MGLFSRTTKKDTTVEQKKTTYAVQARIKNILGLKKLTPMPANAMQAFQLASDPKAAINDFVRIIGTDEALSARILRVANSVYFSRGAPATDIQTAVANIGIEELRCILSAALIRNLLKGQDTFREQLWSNAIATAVFAKGLARFCPNITASEAFLSGLMHDLGKLIMTKETASLYQKVNLKVSTGEFSFIEAEEIVYELNHVEVGKWAADSWNFPALITQAIVEHHLPWPNRKDRINIGTLIGIADTIAHAEGIGHPRGMIGFKQAATEKLASAWKLLEISNEQGLQFIQQQLRQYEENLNMLDIK